MCCLWETTCKNFLHHGFIHVDKRLLFSQESSSIALKNSFAFLYTGGMTALVATLMLGPRRGRFHDLKTGEPLAEPKEIPGHSIALQTLGTLMLWFGCK